LFFKVIKSLSYSDPDQAKKVCVRRQPKLLLTTMASGKVEAKAEQLTHNIIRVMFKLEFNAFIQVFV
jgi:hypothetical protein